MHGVPLVFDYKLVLLACLKLNVYMYSAPMCWFCIGRASGCHSSLPSPRPNANASLAILWWSSHALQPTVLYSYTAWPSLYLVALANTFTDEYLH